MEILTLIINLLPELIPVLIALVTFINTIKSELAKLNTTMAANTESQKELTAAITETQKQCVQL